MKKKTELKPHHLESKIKVTMILADFAEAVNGKLYIMGGGWSITGPRPTPSAIAIKIEVPWTAANSKHEIKLELLDGDYRPVLVPTVGGDAPLIIQGGFEVGRPPGIITGSPLDMPMAFNIPPLTLQSETRYCWRLTINGKSEDDWKVTFSTRPANPPGQSTQG
jgi:hypothetical protein